MIQYANRGMKAYFALLVCMKGSVVPSALPPAILSTGMSIALALTQRENGEVVPDLLWANQAFAIQIYAIILGFLIVTRTNMALSRYTSALQGLQVMISKWLDAYMQLCSFVNAHLESVDSDRQKTLLAWREMMAHWFSLMATFAVAALRGDEGDPNFEDGDDDDGEMDVVKLRTRASGIYHKKHRMPPAAAPARSDNSWRSDGTASSSVAGAPSNASSVAGARSNTTAISGVSGVSDGSENVNAQESNRSVQPRPRPPKRKGTLAAIAAGTSVSVVKDLFYSSMSAMGRSDQCSWPRDVDTADPETRRHMEYLGSCTDSERVVLSQVHDKVLVVSGWICESITRALLRNRPNAPEGAVLKVPPPVVSRVYQELSNGMQAYHHAMMVVIVPFPFPFAQMLTYLLLGFTLLAPFLVLQLTRSVIFSPILTFVGVFGYFGTDSIAKEIENPFGEDTNDLPLLGMHRDFNNSIKELLLPHPHLMKSEEPKGGRGTENGGGVGVSEESRYRKVV